MPDIEEELDTTSQPKGNMNTRSATIPETDESPNTRRHP